MMKKKREKTKNKFQCQHATGREGKILKKNDPRRVKTEEDE